MDTSRLRLLTNRLMVLDRAQIPSSRPACSPRCHTTASASSARPHLDATIVSPHGNAGSPPRACTPGPSELCPSCSSATCTGTSTSDAHLLWFKKSTRHWHARHPYLFWSRKCSTAFSTRKIVILLSSSNSSIRRSRSASSPPCRRSRSASSPPCLRSRSASSPPCRRSRSARRSSTSAWVYMRLAISIWFTKRVSVRPSRPVPQPLKAAGDNRAKRRPSPCPIAPGRLWRRRSRRARRSAHQQLTS